MSLAILRHEDFAFRHGTREDLLDLLWACACFPTGADPSPLERNCDKLGLTPAAEKYLSAAIAADAKLSNAYPSCWFHLWQRRKLVRTETYSVKVLGKRSV